MGISIKEQIDSPPESFSVFRKHNFTVKPSKISQKRFNKQVKSVFRSVFESGYIFSAKD